MSSPFKQFKEKKEDLLLGREITQRWPRFKKYAMKKISNVRRPVIQNTEMRLRGQGIDPSQFKFIIDMHSTPEGIVKNEVKVVPRQYGMDVPSRETRIAETILDEELGYALWVATADKITQMGMKLGERKRERRGVDMSKQ